VSQGSRSWRRQAAITSAVVFLASILGIWSQAVLAATLGLSGATDGYLAALAVCLMVTFILNQSVVNRWVPELSRLLDPSHVPTRAFWNAGRRLTIQVGLIALGLGVLLFVGADTATTWVAPGLSESSRELATTSLRIMALPLAVQLTATGPITMQYALQGQPLIQASGLFYSLSLILAITLLTPVVGPVSAAIGAATSYCLMFLVVVIGTLYVRRKPVSSFEPNAASTHVNASVVIITLATVVAYAQGLVAPFVGSTLGQGTIAELSFAYRPVDLLIRGIPAVVSYAVMPGVAAAFGRRDHRHVDTATSDALRLTTLLMLPVSAVLVAVREPLVSVLYQRSAFSAEAAHTVAATLGWYAAALTAASLYVVLSVMFITVGRERWALLMAVGSVASYACLALVFGTLLGGAGVALAYCVANVATACVGLLVSGRRDVRGMLTSNWFKWTAGGAVAALAFGTLAVLATANLPVLIQLGVGVVFAGIPAAVGVVRSDPALVQFLRKQPLPMGRAVAKLANRFT
jgi:putative peptidoglycan lipid II flippase